jgi:hypothetical protein
MIIDTDKQLVIFEGYTKVTLAELKHVVAVLEREPVDKELFERTAPQWCCVDFPGEGMHYLDRDGGCQWCGMARQQIKEEKEKR